ASVKFRWNLSGTYQQVLPRYISTDINGGDEREFLQEYFPDPGKMLDAVFLKGYQWPFDPRKISDYGSSLIDILVYNETQLKGRRVFLDYTRNPSWGSNNGQLKFSTLGPEAFKYLENSGALFGTPIQRLRKMNRPAIELYKNNFIDLEKDYLEIAVCAQHNNGGLIGNIWWESNIRNFFPVGEVNGTFGVYRPGGTALNSTQTGSLRAAQYISVNYRGEPLKVEKFVSIAIEQIRERVRLADDFILNSNISINMKSSLNNSDNRADSCKSDCQNSYPDSNVAEIKKKVQKRMTMAGAHIRSYKEVNTTVEESIQDIISLSSNIKISSLKELPEAFRVRDIIISQYIYLSAIKEYLDKGGKSRGSYLVHDDNGMFPADNLPQIFGFSLDNGELLNVINEIELKRKGNKLEDGFYIVSRWKPVRPIPQSESWFENVWAQYREMSNN
ncbi:MAG TPA: oxidoreductase, partial [Clostridiales bacterium]|nr:oxidoreductase [Clostridiales bacterium]